MSGVIHIEAGRSFPVSARDGFDYITDPRNWIEYWPRAVSVDPDTRWRQPGDHARVVLRMLGRQVALDMTLVRIDPYRLVEYTSEQDGLPAARHRRHFDEDDGGFAYRIVVEYEPRPNWRGVLDRSVVRKATERTVRETIANLDQRLGRGIRLPSTPARPAPARSPRAASPAGRPH